MLVTSFTSLIVSFATALGLSALIVSLKERIQQRLPSRLDHLAVQASHTISTSRFGGFAIFAGLCVGAALTVDLLPADFAAALIVSALPVLVVGGLEDAGWPMAPRRRLVAAVVSAACASLLLGVWIQRSDLPGFDALLPIAPLGLAVTLFVSAGFCHALNLVDGMNGLAAVNIVATALGLALMANVSGADQISMVALLIVVTTLGFMVFNWPSGRLFLGDAGSYAVGHLLIWLAIALVAYDESIAVGAVMLVLFWPIADMLHAIFRRVLKGAPVSKPDRMHLHQVIRRFLEISWLGRGNRAISNPVTTLVMAPLIVAPISVGIFLKTDPIGSWFWFLGFFWNYAFLHCAITCGSLITRRPLSERKTEAAYYVQPYKN